MDTPVLLLLFNRPVHARTALAQLKSVGVSKLFVHIDGPRPHKPGEVALVAETRKVLESIDWPCTVRTLERQHNLGCRMGVSGAIDWFFGEVEAGIILEDDLVPHPDFFRYATELLLQYKEVSAIKHIGGLNLAQYYTQPSSQSPIPSYIPTHFCFVWGWATWRRAWQEMELSMPGFDAFFKGDRLKPWLPNAKARAYLYEKFRATRAAENNSWAYAWFYTILNNNGLCLTPTVNLVENTGVGDETATHTGQKHDRLLATTGGMNWPMRHPLLNQTDPGFELELFFTSQKSKAQLWLWYLKFRAKKHFKFNSG